MAHYMEKEERKGVNSSTFLSKVEEFWGTMEGRLAEGRDHED